MRAARKGRQIERRVSRYATGERVYLSLRGTHPGTVLAVRSELTDYGVEWIYLVELDSGASPEEWCQADLLALDMVE